MTKVYVRQKGEQGRTFDVSRRLVREERKEYDNQTIEDMESLEMGEKRVSKLATTFSYLALHISNTCVRSISFSIDLKPILYSWNRLAVIAF